MTGRLLFIIVLSAAPVLADDWPQWRGTGRAGVYQETGILDSFPSSGLKVRWRTPIRSGFSGPSVAGGRVFVMDFKSASVNKGVERLLSLDEKTGRILWEHTWEEDYTGLQSTYAIGPRATPTVEGGHVYALGARGALHCVRAADGKPVWSRHLVNEFGSEVPVWGIAGSPLVHGDLVILIAGGAPDAKVMAFDKRTGKEAWRALASDSEPGYSSPILVRHGGVDQLIVWHPRAVSSLNPDDGELLWQQPFKSHLNLNVATPVLNGSHLLISSFFNGSLLLELDRDRPAARELWRGKSDSEIRTDGLHALLATPVIDGDYIYGICSYGQMRCLRLSTGERVWETLDVTGEKARWAAGFIVRHQDRYFINNDRGELILARFTPQGYQEIGRTRLIEPTSNSGNRRQAGAVNWSHPAYANRHIFARNDKEILSASLAK